MVILTALYGRLLANWDFVKRRFDGKNKSGQNLAFYACLARVGK